MPIKLAWNAIVKNEGARIERAMKSLLPYISCMVVLDTGSTDNTIDLIKKFATDNKILCAIGQTEFKDFAQARNMALQAARQVPWEYDYQLLMDADMELKVLDPTWLDEVKGESYDMYQVAGALKYQNRRLAIKSATAGYMAVSRLRKRTLSTTPMAPTGLTNSNGISSCSKLRSRMQKRRSSQYLSAICTIWRNRTAMLAKSIRRPSGISGASRPAVGTRRSGRRKCAMLNV